jgi:hypothetical protein
VFVVGPTDDIWCIHLVRRYMNRVCKGEVGLWESYPYMLSCLRDGIPYVSLLRTWPRKLKDFIVGGATRRSNRGGQVCGEASRSSHLIRSSCHLPHYKSRIKSSIDPRLPIIAHACGPNWQLRLYLDRKCHEARSKSRFRDARDGKFPASESGSILCQDSLQMIRLDNYKYVIILTRLQRNYGKTYGNRTKCETQGQTWLILESPNIASGIWTPRQVSWHEICRRSRCSTNAFYGQCHV